MLNNVTVVEETSTWIRLSAEQPRRDEGLPITHWIAKYELVDEQSPVTALEFHDGRRAGFLIRLIRGMVEFEGKYTQLRPLSISSSGLW